MKFKLCNRNVAFGSAENSPLHGFFFSDLCLSLYIISAFGMVV